MFKYLKNKILIYWSNLLLRVVAVTHGFPGLEKYTHKKKKYIGILKAM